MFAIKHVSRTSEEYTVEHELKEIYPNGEIRCISVFFYQIHDVEDIEQVDKHEDSVRYQLPPNDILVDEVPSEFHDCFHALEFE